MDKTELLNKQNEIDERIKQIWGENCSLDGITDIDIYLRNAKENWHTLWILKEMNRDFRKDGVLTQRDYLKTEAGWNMGTWGNIMRVTAGIREYAASNGDLELLHKDLPNLELEDGNKDYRFYISKYDGEQIFPLDEIAMINVHKGIGNSKSDNSFIAAQYARPEVRELILDQVEYIDPRLIIVCNYVEQLLCDLAGVDNISRFLKAPDSDNLYFKTDKRLIISTGHPLIRGQKGLTSEKYCNDILNIVYGSGI